MDVIIQNLPVALAMGLIGAIIFAIIGVISGTDETATIAPLTLVVILLGVPPAGVFTFFLAGAISKHMTHAVPTMLLGIPGDTMAVPLLDDASRMRALGLPHLALRKAVAGAVLSAFISVPCAVLFAWILSPFGDAISAAAPWIFLAAALGIAYSSQGKWGAIVALIPFVVLVLGLKAWSQTYGVKLGTSYFLGIAVGPMLLALATILVPSSRAASRVDKPATVFLAPDAELSSSGDHTSASNMSELDSHNHSVTDAAANSASSKHASSAKRGRALYPSPFKILDRQQTRATAAAATVSSATFVFSPVAMTVMVGEIVKSRVKQGYQRLTTMIAAKNGTTESTYIAEALIPLIAFGLPLSPVAAGPAAPLFNAPPVFETNAETGAKHNLSSFLSTPEFLVFGLLSALLAMLVAYPFVMRFAHKAAAMSVRKISHEAIISAFFALVVVVSLWEGGIVGLAVTLTIGLVGGLLIKVVKLHAGVLFMGYYVAVLSVPGILSALGVGQM